jgi:Tol biopolymer transport system component
MDIWRVAIDQGSGELRGAAEPVTMSGSAGAMHPSFARDTGTLVYVESANERHIYRLPFNASSGTISGAPALVPGLDRGGLAPDLSADGHIAFVRRQGDSQQVWVADVDGGGGTALTDHQVNAYGARLSPDGQRVAYLSDQNGSLQLWVAPTGGGAARRLTELTTRKVSSPVWSRDGDGIAMSVGGAMLPSYTLLFDPTRPPEAQVARTLLSTPSDRTFEPHSWSPDGTLIAGSIRDGSGHLNGIAVLQVGADQYRRVADFGMQPVWLRDGRRLMFQWRNALYLVDTRSPEPRFVYSSVPDVLGEVFALSADERWIYVSLERSEADIWLLQR